MEVLAPTAQTAAFGEFGLFSDLDDAIVAADPAGSVVFVNPAAERLLGWPAVDLVGRPLEVLVPDRLVDAHRRGFGRFTAGEDLRFTGQPLRLPAVCKDGTEVEVDLVLSALERVGIRLVVATLRAVDTQTVLDDPMATADELVELLHAGDGFALSVNRVVAALGRRLGFDFAALWVPDERIGRVRCVTMWETATGAFPHFTERTREVTIGPEEGITGRAWASGVPVWTLDLAGEDDSPRAQAAAADGIGGGLVLPVIADHEVVGLIEVFSVRSRDLDPGLQRGLMRICAELGQVLQRRLIDEASKLERARLELALDAGGLGAWHWDFASNIITWSERVQAILGRTGEFVGTADDFAALLHPADRDHVLDQFRRILEPGTRERELRLEYRIVADDGSAHWVETRGRVVGEDDGRFLAMTGVTADITERKLAEIERDGAHARLDLALEAGRLGVWDWDLENNEVRSSVTLQLEFGLPPRARFENLEGFTHPDDRVRVRRAVEEAVAKDGRFDLEARLIRPDGQVRWVANRGMAVRGADGRIVSLTGVATDTTEQRNTQARLRRKSQLLQTINNVGRAISSNLDLDEVVQMVTDAATQLTGAEFGAFFYNVSDGAGGHYVLYALSGAPREAFDRFGMPRSTDLFGPTFGGEGVVRLDDVTADPRYGRSAPHYGMPEGHLPVRSYLAVPVVGGTGEVYGGLFFGHPERGRFTDSSESLAVGIAAQAAVAIANARLYAESRQEIAARQRAYEERDRVARVLQRSLMPPALPESPDFLFGARHVPGTEMVGGDFYDVFPLGGGEWGIVIGDVCGKGPEAAAVTALARYTVRSAAAVAAEPREVLGFLNDALIRDPAVDRFCSVVYGRLQRLDGGAATFRIGHAGHPPSIVIRTDGTVEPAMATGMLVGIVGEPTLAQETVTLEPGDSIVLYTDGIVESRRGTDAFGIDRLVELAATLGGAPPQEIADTITDAARSFADRVRHDDIAVVVTQVASN